MNIGLKSSKPFFWRLLQDPVSILDFQFTCVTRLQATLRLASFYNNFNNSPNVIIGIPNVNFLVSRNTKGTVQILHILEVFLFREGICIFVTASVV